MIKSKERHMHVKIPQRMFKDFERVCKEENYSKQELLYSLLDDFLYGN